MNNTEKVTALEALLARVQKNAAVPRAIAAAPAQAGAIADGLLGLDEPTISDEAFAPPVPAAARAPKPAAAPIAAAAAPAATAARAPAARGFGAAAKPAVAKPAVPAATPSPKPAQVAARPAAPAPAAAAKPAGGFGKSLGLGSIGAGSIGAPPERAQRPQIPREDPESPRTSGIEEVISPARVVAVGSSLEEPFAAAPAPEVAELPSARASSPQAAPPPPPARPSSPQAALPPSDDFLPLVDGSGGAEPATFESEPVAVAPPAAPAAAAFEPVASEPAAPAAAEPAAAAMGAAFDALSLDQPAVAPAPTPAPEPAPVSAPEPAAPPAPALAAGAEEAPSKFAGEPAAAPPKKKGGLSILLVALVAIVIGGGVLIYLQMQPAPTPPKPTSEPTGAAPPAKPTATATAAATATATATAEATAAPTASASAAPETPPGEVALPKDPATLAATMGYLIVKAPQAAAVFASGKQVGETNSAIEIACVPQSKFITVGEQTPAGTKFLAKGKNVKLACRAATNLEFTDADIAAGPGAAPAPGAPAPGAPAPGAPAPAPTAAEPYEPQAP